MVVHVLSTVFFWGLLEAELSRGHQTPSTTTLQSRWSTCLTECCSAQQCGAFWRLKKRRIPNRKIWEQTALLHLIALNIFKYLQHCGISMDCNSQRCWENSLAIPTADLSTEKPKN